MEKEKNLKVKDLIEYLQRFDQEKEIEIFLEDDELYFMELVSALEYETKENTPVIYVEIKGMYKCP